MCHFTVTRLRLRFWSEKLIASDGPLPRRGMGLWTTKSVDYNLPRRTLFDL